MADLILPSRVVTLCHFIIATGRWNLMEEIGADGQPIARPELRELPTGTEVESAIFALADLESYLSGGRLAPAESPEAAAVIARAERERG